MQQIMRMPSPFATIHPSVSPISSVRPETTATAVPGTALGTPGHGNGEKVCVWVCTPTRKHNFSRS